MRFLILLIFLLFSQNALSHEWYPIECCDKKDCAEIIKMKQNGGPRRKIHPMNEDE